MDLADRPSPPHEFFRNSIATTTRVCSRIRVQAGLLQRRDGGIHTSSAVVKRGAHLTRILRPSVNVCVWRRALPKPLQGWLSRLNRVLVRDVSLSSTFDQRALPSLFTGLPDCPEVRAWAGDVALLATLFTRLLGTDSFQASLATVHTNKCCKFHSDYKPLRLVCTYAGPGTEWVDDRDVDRAELGHEESCFDTANARIVPRGSSVQRARAGDVVLLKGELFPGYAGRGAIHRSPPIESTGERRIVFTLDAL